MLYPTCETQPGLCLTLWHKVSHKVDAALSSGVSRQTEAHRGDYLRLMLAVAIPCSRRNRLRYFCSHLIQNRAGIPSSASSSLNAITSVSGSLPLNRRRNTSAGMPVILANSRLVMPRALSSLLRISPGETRNAGSILPSLAHFQPFSILPPQIEVKRRFLQFIGAANLRAAIAKAAPTLARFSPIRVDKSLTVPWVQASVTKASRQHQPHFSVPRGIGLSWSYILYAKSSRIV
jgi:hypothetical protein